MPLSFNNKSNADGYRNQQGFTPKPENSDSTWCPSMLFLSSLWCKSGCVIAENPGV